MLKLPALSFSLSIFSLMLSAVLSNSTTNDSNIYVQCSELYFDSMTPYESNLNSLFTSLIDSSSIYNFNKFQISPPPGYDSQVNDVVYGLFQCRGDLSSSNCKECVTNSVSQLKTNCPVSMGAGIQLDGCFVKYDNSSFFGADDKMEVLKRCDLNSVGYNSDVLNRIDGALTYLINAGNGEYFRSGEYGSILGVAQCVQDLSVSDCQECISEACGRLRSACEASPWGDMYLGKCYIRYFDQDSYSHPSTSNSNKSSGGGISGSDLKEWIAIILSALTATGVGVTAYAVTNRNENSNENRNNNSNENRNNNRNENSNENRNYNNNVNNNDMKDILEAVLANRDEAKRVAEEKPREIYVGLYPMFDRMKGSTRLVQLDGIRPEDLKVSDTCRIL